MAVSSTPFKISCPSPLWVPRSCPCSSSSWPASTALRRRNCWPVHRREMCFLQSPYQYPSNIVPFCGCVHIKQQNSSFSTKLHLDANTGWIDSSSQHMVSGQPSYYRSAKPGSLSPTVGNYERLRFREEDGSAHVHMYGMTGRGEQKLVKSHNDFLPSPLSEYSWSSATFEMKESKKVYRQGTVNVKTSSDLDKANGSAYENSDLNGGFGRLKFDTLSRSGVINSPCIDVHEKIDRVNLRTHKELDEPENVKQLNHGNGKAGKVKQLGTEDRENPRFEDSTGHEVNGISSESVPIAAEERVIVPIKDDEVQIDDQLKLRSRLCGICNKVLVVDSIQIAREVVGLLTNQYRHLVYACDTEVSDIDVKQETPVNHGKIICFSIYSDKADFGHGKSCLWVDILDGGGKDLLAEFAPFFEDPSIQKVWHNYSFDSHIVSNYGIQISGFHADTMHMARLWDSSRRTEGGYSLEALTRDPKIFLESQIHKDPNLIGKVSMKTLFGRRKMKKDGSLGKVIAIPPVEELQREDREPWICYSSLDSISTLKLYESLRSKLSKMPWTVNRNKSRGSMFDFYRHYWRPFGELLVKMEAEGMLVDRSYLAEVEKVAISEQQVAADRFRTWASRYCPDAKYMNVGSDTQLRQLLFGGISNRKNPDERLPDERTFRVPNLDNIIEEGKKTPKKYRDITLRKLDIELRTESFTPSGWPSVSADALKILAGKVSAEYDFSGNSDKLLSFDESGAVEEDTSENIDASVYGTAYDAFNGGQEGREVCHAIAALCEVCSMDSLISNFILPLQGSHVSGKTGRVHCSLNINTETGRLSARRPNLQNQPALEKDRYKIRQAFIASPGNSLIVADYGQLELRILAHLADCKSMKEAFEAGGDFHSRTAMNMYSYIREAVERKEVLLEWHPQPGEDKPPVPLLKDAFGSERRKAKMLNFSIAYGKTPMGLAKDWKVSVQEAKKTVDLWYKERQEVRKWQEARKREALETGYVHTLLGRARRFPLAAHAGTQQRSHVERAAINTPVQGSAADVAMCAMLEIANNARLKELGWRLLLQVHDEVILEGPRESEEEAKALVVNCMSKPFNGTNILNVELVVDANCAQNWYAAK